MADILWLVVVAGGPLLLAVVILFAMTRQRRLTRREHDRQASKIDQLYELSGPLPSVCRA